MNSSSRANWIAFSGNKRIASGKPRVVASEVKRFVVLNDNQPVLIFDTKTSALIKMDFRGDLSDVLDRLPVERGQETENISFGKVLVGAAGRQNWVLSPVK